MCVDEAGMVVMSAFNTEGEQLRPLAGRFDGTDAAGGVISNAVPQQMATL